MFGLCVVLVVHVGPCGPRCVIPPCIGRVDRQLEIVFIRYRDYFRVVYIGGVRDFLLLHGIVFGKLLVGGCVFGRVVYLYYVPIFGEFPSVVVVGLPSVSSDLLGGSPPVSRQWAEPGYLSVTASGAQMAALSVGGRVVSPDTLRTSSPCTWMAAQPSSLRSLCRDLCR